MRWLEEGAADDGEVTVPSPPSRRSWGSHDDRPGLLEVMGALGELEERRLAARSTGAPWAASRPG